MNKYLLLILMLALSISTRAQLSLSTKHDHIMDSTSIYNINFRYIDKSNSYVNTYVTRKVKITFSTRVNKDNFKNDYLSDDDIRDDYLSIFKYDVRAKFYLSRDVRFTTRTVVMGSRYKTNQYSMGFLIKF